MDTLKQIAERLKGLRDSLELSVDEMAAECGVSAETLEKYESGDYDIPVVFFNALHLAKE